MEMPRGIGPFHIVGIGGIGMSAIAEILLELGYTVQGSDAKESANVRRLRSRGIRCMIGHGDQNLDGARYVVVSSAIKRDNPEVMAARKLGLPVIRRADMLAELMRTKATVSVTGTHGKTTTTSLVAHIFEHAKLDPTVITGGILASWGSNARLGKGDWMVVEADESDGTFNRLPTQIGVITNIDPEHLDYFGSVEAMHAAYRAFYRDIPFYGTAVTCIDHPVVRSMLKDLASELCCKVLSYGYAEDADIRLHNVRSDGPHTVFDAEAGPRVTGGARNLLGLAIPVPGEHNALNALAAFAVAAEAGVPDDAIRQAIATYPGVKRRFTLTGTWNGIPIYDDYAHHPVEVAATLKAARTATQGRVIAVFQPHRYSRVSSLFGEFTSCFADADCVIVTPIYSAGEAAIPGIDHLVLAEGIRKAGHGHVMTVASEHEIAPAIAGIARAGDLVIGLGAGTISDWNYALPGWLASQRRAMAGE